MDLITPQTAIEAIRVRRMVIVVDDADRENEGDLVMAAECVTPEAINFMETRARGWVCVPLAAERLEALDLPLMVACSTERQGTAFTVTVDARRGTTTGISCEDQAATIRALVDERTPASDLLRPGHVRPLRTQPGGVLVRAGHAEAAADLARLAGLAPAGIICEIKNPDGGMARLPELRLFAARHGLPILTIADLIEYRRRTEKLVRRVPLSAGVHEANRRYLETKRDKLGHLLPAHLLEGSVLAPGLSDLPSVFLRDDHAIETQLAAD